MFNTVSIFPLTVFFPLTLLSVACLRDTPVSLHLFRPIICIAVDNRFYTCVMNVFYLFRQIRPRQSVLPHPHLCNMHRYKCTYTHIYCFCFPDIITGNPTPQPDREGVDGWRWGRSYEFRNDSYATIRIRVYPTSE